MRLELIQEMEEQKKSQSFNPVAPNGKCGLEWIVGNGDIIKGTKLSTVKWQVARGEETGESRLRTWTEVSSNNHVGDNNEWIASCCIKSA